jgi:nitronate monooxygenase
MEEQSDLIELCCIAWGKIVRETANFDEVNAFFHLQCFLSTQMDRSRCSGQHFWAIETTGNSHVRKADLPDRNRHWHSAQHSIKEKNRRRLPMALKTRLTECYGLKHPVLSAPMAFVAGGMLAGAVTRAGGLGVIGGGYGDADWLEAQFLAAGNASVGCGFITWSLANAPHLLDQALDHKPANIFLSFGDPAPFAPKIKAAGVQLICQIQTIEGAKRAIDVGANVIVAQGAEAGGHAATRATLPLVPEVADLLANFSPDTLLCAAGGIADGRGLAAAMMLGADGVLVGSRFSACEEALVFPGWHDALLAADGDITVQTSIVDIARKRDWPGPYKIRVLNNDLMRRWQDQEEEMREFQDKEATHYDEAIQMGDTNEYGVIVGENVGLINSIEPAATVLERMVAQAETLLQGAPTYSVAAST